MKSRKWVSSARFYELFYWGQDDVRIYRKIRINRYLVNSEVGGRCKTHGYWFVRIDGKAYKRSWLVWWKNTGKWPRLSEGFIIDHIDQDRVNDTFSNLREIRRPENYKNRSRQNNNTSGANGVGLYKDTGKWYAHIRVDKKRIHLGTFCTFKEATIARKNADRKHRFHFNHGVK